MIEGGELTVILTEVFVAQVGAAVDVGVNV